MEIQNNFYGSKKEVTSSMEVKQITWKQSNHLLFHGSFFTSMDIKVHFHGGSEYQREILRWTRRASSIRELYQV